MKQIKVGTLLIDMDRIGIVINIFKSGTMDIDLPLIKWRKNYLIYYQDGRTLTMGDSTIRRLVDEGKIRILNK